MLMKYVLVYEKLQVFNEGTCLTKMVGPFDTFKEASHWHEKHTPDTEAQVDVICSPDIFKD